MGFPVVTIDTQTGTISQQHFLTYSVDSIMTSDYKYVYSDNISLESYPIVSELEYTVFLSSKIIAVTNGMCQSPG